jgi:hypothetical protein
MHPVILQDLASEHVRDMQLAATAAGGGGGGRPRPPPPRPARLRGGAAVQRHGIRHVGPACLSIWPSGHSEPASYERAR